MSRYPPTVLYSLFIIPSPFDWTTDQVANVINLLGAIGTVGALLYAFYLERKNSKKINDLQLITTRLAEQNELISQQIKLQRMAMKETVRPDIIPKGNGVYSPENKLAIRLMNQGPTANITKVEFAQKDLAFVKKDTPLLLKKDMQIEFNGVPKNDKPMEKCEWSIFIEYTDSFRDKYGILMRGTGVITDEIGFVDFSDKEK